VFEPGCVPSLAVTVNGEVLSIEDVATQSTKKSVPAGDGTTMEVTWQLFAPGIGPYVEIETGDPHSSRYLCSMLSARFFKLHH
jgi:hypothetical protein